MRWCTPVRFAASSSGKTQREVAEKLRSITTEIDRGVYLAPSKMRLGEWLDIWTDTYLEGVKPRTKDIDCSFARLHIKPALGAIRLEELTPHAVQSFYNALLKEYGGKPALSPKTVKEIHGVMRLSLKHAVLNGCPHSNPTDAFTPPRVVRLIKAVSGR